MNKWFKRKRGGVFALLLGNYILFTTAVALVLIALFAYVLLRSYNSVMDFDVSQIEACDDLLRSGSYDAFPTARLLGEKGFIAVLDEQSHTVYNGGSLELSLTREELRYIPPYEVMGSTFATDLPLGDGTVHHQIIRDSGTATETYILDEHYRLLYASGDYIASDLTEKEYRLLTQDYFDGYTTSRYSFPGVSGEAYTLLLFRAQESGHPVLTRLGRAISDSGLIFLIVYCTMIACFILWLKRKITSPLHLLCRQLNGFELGRETASDYRGPREFESIFESFAAMAARLRDSEAQRKKLEADKKSMLAGITHDLKTPITVVQGYAKALSDGVIPMEQQSNYLEIVAQKADELGGLIDTFHAYNQLEHPEYGLNQEKTDICNYFRDYAADRYAQLEAAGFSLRVEIPETHLFCMADRAQLRRVLDNLVGNALKHNPKGTTIYFDLLQRGDTALLTLADNGVGIPEELAGDIFSPFVMGDASRKGSGSGLGLSIALRIVQAHGGALSLTAPPPGYQTAFLITLPLMSQS